MKALIFGIAGQDGYYLNELLDRSNIEVIGVSRSVGDWIQGNVSNFQFVEDIVKREKPEYIFHFAAISTTRHDALFENHESIATGTINILESCLIHSPKTKVFLTGSALQFENVGLPITENNPFTTENVYTLTRNYSTFAGRYYRTLGLRVYIGYLFHHDSPKRSDQHINKKIVDAAKLNGLGISQNIHIGDPDVVKEFNFAGDIMEGVWLLVNQDFVFETVIGSGKGYKILDWVEICFNLVGIDWRDHLIVPSGYKSSFSSLVSNPKTICGLGWEPKVDIHDLAKMMIEA